VPHAQSEDARGLNFVTHLVSTHENPADLAWFVLFQLFPDARLIEESVRYRGQ